MDGRLLAVHCGNQRLLHHIFELGEVEWLEESEVPIMIESGSCKTIWVICGDHYCCPVQRLDLARECYAGHAEESELAKENVYSRLVGCEGKGVRSCLGGDDSEPEVPESAGDGPTNVVVALHVENGRLHARPPEYRR